MHDLTRTTITSMEAAEWCGKKHNELLKDIRRYISQLRRGENSPHRFFQGIYNVTEQNKALPCFLVTKKGCEFIAHKMTGQKERSLPQGILTDSMRWSIKSSPPAQPADCFRCGRSGPSNGTGHEKSGFSAA